MVTVDTARPTASFDPTTALGAGVDGMEAGGVKRLFTGANVKAMEDAGLGPITYRLRTELGIAVWHFSGEGAWSDAARAQGYWTSSDHPSAPILVSWGYDLPRRGDTIDMAANAGFSRLDDGDPKTFWKSNPYLDRRYTGEPGAHPQWAVAEFAKPVGVDEAVIDWAQPFARRFQVQYWIGADEYDDEGRWATFPGGSVDNGHGGRQRLDLARSPVRARFFRVLMEQSSRTTPAGSTDPRDAMGYAIGELELGRRTAVGGFVDAIRHGRTRFTQTVMHVSSTDPWHRAVDRDPDLEQPGLDLVFESGLTRGLPVMIPVGALYDTPENAAAEIRFLKARGYPLARVEIGEEPDGQIVEPADYGALYIEVARAVRSADPTVPIGGPSLMNAVADDWLTSDPDRSWTSRFLKYLKARGALGDFQFVSFERYPFDDLCGDLSKKLVAESRMLPAALARLDADGAPAGVPRIISEYGFSAFGGRGEVEVAGALIDADIAAQFLSLGGKAAYLFGYGPSRPYAAGHQPCAGWGDLMLFEADKAGQARWPLPTFFESRMLTQDWAGRGPGADEAFPARVAGPAARFVAAYPIRRADGSWRLLLLNRDRKNGYAVGVTAADGRAPKRLATVQYGQDQYAWRAAGPNGHPVRDRPPRRFTASAESVMLPPWSITMVGWDSPAR